MEHMEDPGEINKKEIMEYYRYSGPIGAFQYYFLLLKNWLLQSLAKSSIHPGISAWLHKIRGVSVGKNVYIGPGVTLDLVYPGMIEIGDYVSIGMNSMIFAHSNPTNSLELKKKHYPRNVAKVSIGKGAWIAPGCIILAGVTIGENSVVGAGSVVIRDVESFTVVAGNPAKPIKTLGH